MIAWWFTGASRLPAMSMQASNNGTANGNSAHAATDSVQRYAEDSEFQELVPKASLRFTFAIHLSECKHEVQ